jgi:tetratricopeptide (TPR) repeat protein
MVAHHFTQAELPDQAIDYWLRAGEHALNCSANVEAVGHLTRGIELIDALPAPPERVDKSLRLHLALGAAMQATRGVGAPETLRAFSRARHLLDVRGTLADNMAVLRGLWNGYLIRGRLREAVDLLDRRPTLATPDGDAEVSALIDRFKGITLHMMGRFIDARAHLEQSIQFYAASQRGGTSAHFAYLTDDRIGATAYLTRTLWLLGYPEQARAVGARSLKRARARVHAMTVATALLSEMFLAAFSADRDHMAAAAAELLRHSLESKLASYEYWARLFQGVLMSGSGDPRGIEIMDGAVAAAARVGSGLSRPMVLCQLAHGHANLGRSELALAALDEGIEAAGAMAVGEHVAELRRFRGETLRSLGRKQEAAIELERALAIARDQQARWWELRVATSLARVWRDDGKPAEARQLLAPVYGWFAEGFDLPDLRTARALLDELDRQCRR